jgi:hypothetical protein
MKFIKFPSIEQYRTIVKNIQHDSTFVGIDENGNSVFDVNRPKPVVSFVGTVKLHGTNAGVCSDGKDIWAQKRTGRITVQGDNAGFALFVESHNAAFKEIFDNFTIPEGHILAIYGEWCGRNIQKGVAISGLDKMFVIFDAKEIEEEGNGTWLSVDEVKAISSVENKIYNIYDFQTYVMTIDFNHPELAQNDFIRITEEVEAECPVGKHFGVEAGVGEGIVWRGVYRDVVHRFKVKGEKHSSSRVKTLANVDVEKIASCVEFTQYAVTDNRLEQGWNELFTSNNIDPTRKDTAEFLRWVVNDVLKEEMDVMVENGLEPKNVNKFISEHGRKWFFNRIDNVTFGESNGIQVGDDEAIQLGDDAEHLEMVLNRLFKSFRL